MYFKGLGKELMLYDKKFLHVIQYERITWLFVYFFISVSGCCVIFSLLLRIGDLGPNLDVKAAKTPSIIMKTVDGRDQHPFRVYKEVVEPQKPLPTVFER